MVKQVNMNFHQTFKPECKYISSILDIADGTSWLSVKDISGMTGIPQGASSGKVEPHISYAEYMGLIKSEKKDKQIQLTRTALGENVSMEDPGLQESLTKLLLHAMILRQEEGASMWSSIFKNILPKYRNGIKKDMLILELNQIYDNKVTTKNISPFFGSYDDLFAEIKILNVEDDVVKCNSFAYNKEFIYMYALALWAYWEEYYPEQEEISSVQFEKVGFGKAFGWNTQVEYEVMEHLADRGLLRMNRQLMPYTILKLTNKEELISNLYSELC
ncbi:MULTISPECIES: hypothetical protein [Clostridia]|uniref:hypothetical protein n=1 Tax=Clostridia TaxID=186801 RepID=UPI00067EC8DA|nr:MULTISPECIES: hypothetical protein [Clostridia]